MAPTRKPAPFPGTDEIRRFIADSPERVGAREIARAFGLKGAQRARLKRVLRELLGEGVDDRPRRRAAGRLPAVTVVEVVEIDIDGELIARPTGRHSEGRAPRIVMADRARGRSRINAPALGVGDRVLARLAIQPDGSYEGRIMRVIEGAPDRVIGVFHAGGSGGRIQPTDRRAKKDFLVSAGDRAGALSGEMVLAESLSGRRLGLPRARIVERLGALDAPRAISLLAIHSHGIPTAFPDQAIAQATAAKPVPLGNRRDFRDLPLVTIDGADARDFDDAVWAAPDDEPANPGGYRLVVAIADVAHYVRPGDPLDRAALERGNSVYFPDRVVPMLPEALSNDLCSLRPGEDRACLVCTMRISASGARLAHRFERGLMCSAVRLTYNEVQAAADGDRTLDPALRDGVIAPLYGVSKALAKARGARGTLELDLPEMRVVVDEAGAVEAVRPEPRHDSHRLIEDCMIAANVAAAETLQKAQAPCLYRIHDRPDPAKIESLRQFLATLDLTLPRGGSLTAAHFNAVLKTVRDTPQEHLVSLVVLRSQAQAAYAPGNIGHFGLALKRYCHFTSPIRRYADLLVHRALIAAFELGEGGLTEGAGGEFEEIGGHISGTERRAQLAERDAKDRYMTAYLAARVGAEFSARIAGVTRFGLFVALDETGAEGLIPIRTLGPGHLTHDEARHALVGSGRTYRLGERLAVRLAEADAITGGLVFELVDGKGGGGRTSIKTIGGRQRGRRGKRRS